MMLMLAKTRARTAALPNPASMAMRGGLVAVLLGLGGCSGIDFGDNPGREVAKQAGPLTIPPEHLKDGQSE